MMSSEKNSAGPTSAAASIRISVRGLPGGARSRCLCAFSIMTMAASIIAPMAIAMPPRLMMLEPMPSSFMATNAISIPTGSIRIATKALRTCSRKTMHTSATIKAFFEQRRLERGDGTVDQLRAVVDRHDLRPFGQRRHNLLEPVLDVVDDGQRIGAEALQRDAARHFAVAVEFGDAATFVAGKFNAGHVLQQYRGAAVGLHDDIFDVIDAFEVATTAHHELVLGEFQRASADVHVAAANDVADFGQRNAERAQAARIDDDVVLLDETADAGDLGDALGLGETKANVPILQRAQVAASDLFLPSTAY